MKSRLLTLCFALLSLTAAAQVCNGVLGTPILNLTFGQGNASQSAYSPLATYAPGMSTSTTLQPSGLLGAANTSGLVKTTSTFGSPPSWVTSTDHTGNPYGLFFGMNMPDNAGVIVMEYLINDLCPNTTLEYSIWLLNLMAPTNPYANSPLVQYPNITMRILDPANNILIQQSTGNVPIDAAWHHYTLLFSNGSNTSVKLQLINNTVGSSYGNDLALDDITIRPCVPDAGVLPHLDTTLCATTNMTFNASLTSGVYSVPVFQWQYSTDGGVNWINTSSTGSTFNFNFNTANAPLEYRIRYIVSPQGVIGSTNCHAISDTTIIRIDTVAHNFLSPDDTLICNGASLTLDAAAAQAAAYLWNTGANSSSITASAAGTYWAQVTSTMGCKAADTITINYRTVTAVDLGPDVFACAGTTLMLQPATTSGTASYRWNTGGTGTSIQVHNSGTYWLQSSEGGCLSSDSIVVTINEIPVVNLGPDLLLCEAATAILQPDKNYPDGQYNWSTGSASHGLTAGPGTYWLSITRLPDCSAADTIIITSQKCDCSLYLPNAFSPNNDGLNDEFYPLKNECPVMEYSFQVYNRWGERVFYTTSPTGKWDGMVHYKTADVGTYFYYIRFTEVATQHVKTYKGDVTLMR